MKKILVCLIVLYAAAALAATEPAGDNGQKTPPAQDQPETAAPEDSRATQAGSSWPEPFEASEKIGADSVVSFPADISQRIFLCPDRFRMN